jgi:hypothetical protein
MLRHGWILPESIRRRIVIELIPPTYLQAGRNFNAPTGPLTSFGFAFAFAIVVWLRPVFLFPCFRLQPHRFEPMQKKDSTIAFVPSHGFRRLGRPSAIVTCFSRLRL